MLYETRRYLQASVTVDPKTARKLSLTLRPGFGIITPCLVGLKINSPSSAQRSVLAGAQETNFLSVPCMTTEHDRQRVRPFGIKRRGFRSGDRLDNAIKLLRQLELASRPVRRVVQLRGVELGKMKLRADKRTYRLLKQYKNFEATVQAVEQGRALQRAQAARIGRLEARGGRVVIRNDISSFLKFSRQPYYKYASRRLDRVSAQKVLEAIGDKVCTCTLSDGNRKRSWPSTKEACVAAASQYGLDWAWECGD